MFGAIYGDVIGSYYEVHCTKNYNFEFNKDSCFTDDSVLIAGGIAEAFYKEIPEHIKRFCESRIDGSIKSVVKEFNTRYSIE